MSYSINLEKAAKRHFCAAETLNTTIRRDVAGYLYGIAAECAIKALMRKSGIVQSSPTAKASGDPYYAHFPDLKTLLLNRCQGRNSQVLQRFVGDSRFMQNWDIKMRYAPPNEITNGNVDKWRLQAKEAIQKMLGK